VPPGSGGAAPPRGRIFLLDDNPLTVNMIEQFLLREGFAVAKATDPVEALQAELPFAPEVAILDAMMPGMSGFEFAQALKKALGSGVRIVMLTALRREADRERGLASGADAYLTKPVRPDELLAAVEAQLAAARGGRAAAAVEDLARILAGAGTPEEKVRAAAERLAREGSLPG